MRAMTDTFTVRHYDSLGSTNDEAWRLARDGAPHGSVIHADEQTAGRGRLARTWFSPPGNLYVSIVLRPEMPPARTPELSFVAAIAVADTVAALLPKRLRPHLKWPNDVLVEGAKISGILLESDNDVAILGIGLNVLEAPMSGIYKTTTIAANGGLASVDSARDILLARLGDGLGLWRREGFAAVRDAWLAWSYPIGETIRVNASGAAREGKFAGLDETGALLLETTAGIERHVTGDVALRG